MSLNRRAARIDHTQKAIVDALRRCGVQVWMIGKPVDLLAAHRGSWFVLECKSKGGTLTAAQEEFINMANAKVHVAFTPDEAIRAVLGPEVMR